MAATIVSFTFQTRPNFYNRRPLHLSPITNPSSTSLTIGIKFIPQRVSLRSSHVGPLYFAAIPTGHLDLSTQWKMAAGAISKWLDIYNNLLLIRVLLSWFPNLNWEKQPFSALRSLCDPYLSLFSNIIPPVFGLDVSPLLAFAVLQFLMSLLAGTPSVVS